MTPWLTIIGVGDDGVSELNPTILARIDAVSVVFGSKRLLTQADWPKAELHFWEDGYDLTLAKLMARRGLPTLLLATGDPMHFGIGATLSTKLSANEYESIHNASAFSLAAACLKWPLQDVSCISLHGRPIDQLARHLSPGARLFALTSSGQTIVEAAAVLQRCGYGRSRMIVLEHMGGPQERTAELLPEEAADQSFADLNTLAIECEAFPQTPHFGAIPGLPDHAFIHDGQLTKREIRAVTLSALQPFPGAVLWDIGAGCGSIAIEWMRAASRASAFAIEDNDARIAMIVQNAKTLGVPELKVIKGHAPVALKDLPEPDAIFIGGGITDQGVFETAFAALKPNGFLVANAVTTQGEARLLALADAHHGSLSRIAVSRAEAVGNFSAFKPMMPVTMLTIRKKRPV
jgi:precorrin-6B C5,15-methyltransferase / cobalt-precorrin-6B C5,C15-methyltransferase